MISRVPQSLRVTALAVAGAVTLGALPVAAPLLDNVRAARTVLAETVLLDSESWIMGGSGLPIPPPTYLQALSERYVDPTAFPEFSGGQPLFAGQPLFPVTATNPLFTPEGLYPLTGVKSLELDTSAAQGMQILNSTIYEQIAAGNHVVVVGYSQSATISALEMKNLLAMPAGDQPTADDLSFVLLGSPSTPNGGLLARFGDPSLPPLTLPSVGITFSGATPSDTPWDTAMYIREYDGFADFPRYPLNFLADLNAFLGIMFIHGKYPVLTAEQISTAIPLPVSDGYTGHTQYFMIPTETLPLAQLLSSIPLVGKPLADLLEPSLRVLVNLGYGDVAHGWDQGPADVPTPFGVFPNVSLGDILGALGNSAQEGVGAVAGGVADQPLAGLGDQLGAMAAGDLPGITDLVNALTSATATAYATLLPTADIVNMLTTTLPAYFANLFVHELSEGNLLDAIGMPLAAGVGLTTMAAGFEVEVLMNAFSQVSAMFADLTP